MTAKPSIHLFREGFKAAENFLYVFVSIPYLKRGVG